jgi:hypothetical protein
MDDYLKGIRLNRNSKVSTAVFTADQVHWRENIKKINQEP